MHSQGVVLHFFLKKGVAKFQKSCLRGQKKGKDPQSADKAEGKEYDFRRFGHKNLPNSVVILYAHIDGIHSIPGNKRLESLTKTFGCVRVLGMNVKGKSFENKKK